MPAANVDYWNRKFERNVARDAQNKADLESDGWRVMVVWECELKDLTALQFRFLDYFNKICVDGV